MQKQDAWIDVYPFEGRNLSIYPTGKKVTLDKELLNYMKTLPEPRFNSWIPSASSIVFDETKVNMHFGTMQYTTVKTITESLTKRLPFAPKLGFNPAISVGFVTATKDSKVIFQRRPEGIHCPRTLIHKPCGYMSAGCMSPCPENPADEKNIKLKRLYDVRAQLERRRKEIADTFKVPVDLVSYNNIQDFFGTGWRTVESYLSTTGKIDMEEKDLKLPENREFVFVPFEQLKYLIYNQGKLSQVNPESYEPKDSTDIPMLDESISGLMWGYEKLTGENLDLRETMERINHDGLSMRVYDTSSGMKYEFPTNF